MAEIYYDEVEFPVGPMLLASNGEEMIRIDYGTLDSLADALEKWYSRYFADAHFVRSPQQTGCAREELAAYFSGRRKLFSFKYKLYGTSFQKQVWQALVETIPYGETAAYKDIAARIGNPKAVRAVGGAVNKNPLSIIVPCHRVIGSSGKMVGYNGGLDKKTHLLELEYNSAEHAFNHE
jgi:O-6-methylguanine DNA methyltransferase